MFILYGPDFAGVKSYGSRLVLRIRIRIQMGHKVRIFNPDPDWIRVRKQAGSGFTKIGYSYPDSVNLDPKHCS